MIRLSWILIWFCSARWLSAQYQFPEPGIVFVNEEVPVVEIWMDSDDLDFILNPANENNNEHFSAQFIFRSSQANDTINEVGFRLRGNTSRSAAKKSFKISFNSFVSGQKYHGLEKLNLNGEHNDPSIIRSKLSWDLFNQMGVPSSRANHVELYINGEYRGLYINVEHVDEEFIKSRMSDDSGNLWKCLWPADLHYKGSNPLVYAEESSWGRRAYDLKTNVEEWDYSALAKFIYVLNEIPLDEMECELPKVFDVDSYLKAIVIDILTSNWDGPLNKNNFYLYYNPTTDQISYIPYDLDNTFGIDWFGINWSNTNIYNWSDNSGEYRPLFKRILAVDAWRHRFSFYFDEALNEYFSQELLGDYLDEKQNLIFPSRLDDPFAGLDYNFTVQDFVDSYEADLGGHIPKGLKQYINDRINTSKGQLSLPAISPYVQMFNLDWSEDLIQFQLFANDDGSVLDAKLHYSIEGGLWESKDFVFNMEGEGILDFMVTDQGRMEYYVELTDNDDLIGYYPECKDGMVQLGYAKVYNLVINEFLASNVTSQVDDSGAFEDWIEIYNAGDETVPLFDYFITDDLTRPNKFKLPATTLAPDEYLIIWADDDMKEGNDHSNFKLNKDGEFIGIFDGPDNNFAVIDSISFGKQQDDVSLARSPNGSGDFTFADYHTFSYNNDLASSATIVNEDSVSFYPNPASFSLTINSKDNLSFKLFNNQGLLIHQGALKSGSQNFDISELINGLYFIELKSNSKTIIQKLIVQH